MARVNEGSSTRTDARRARHEPRRRELLDAAVSYVMEHGLDGLSIRPLATALGIGHRTLLYYFGSKEELIVEILGEFRCRDRNVLDVQGTILAANGLRAFEATWEAMSDEHLLPYWRFFFEAYGHAVRDPERHVAFLGGIVSDWLSLIERHLVSAGCDPVRATPLAGLVLATFRGLILDLVATGDRARGAASVRELAALVRNSIV
jgi:AcrR family transcriptional regulator